MTPLFDTIGGTAGCHRLAEALYTHVAHDPILRPFFPGKSFKCAIHAFAAFLVQFLGGPAEDSQFRWWLSLHESHRRFRIGRRERTAWLKDMSQALDDVELDSSARDALRAFFEQSSALLVNQGEPPEAPPCTHPELARRWKKQCAIEEAVAEIRVGKLQAIPDADASVRVRILSQMIATHNPAMLDRAHSEIRRDPALIRARYTNRTLLHAAASAGSLSTVELLLSLGADPNDGDHTPLYRAANECGSPAGAPIVRALVKAGADVNAPCGAKRCTPLHMAARRGHTAIAKALLELGADPNARDSAGVTPLRRALNCRKPEVARLLETPLKVR
jgi:hemoglobin